MRDTVKLTSFGNVAFHHEMRERNNLAGTKLEYQIGRSEYKILLESGLFDKPKDVRNRPPFSAIGIPNDEVAISYDMPHWEVFENTVWKLFVQMNFDCVNQGKFGIDLDNGEYFAANGVFINSDFVFLCKTLYAPKSGGQDIESLLLGDQVDEWMKNFSPACDYLTSEYLEFEEHIFPETFKNDYPKDMKIEHIKIDARGQRDT